MTKSTIPLSCIRLTIYVACLCLLIFSGNIASARNTDSLLSVLKGHPQNDTLRVNLLVSLSVIYINNNIDSSIRLANEGLSISQNLDYNKGESLCMQALAQAYLTKNEYDKALSYFNKALTITEKNGMPIGVALIYSHMGDAYTRESKHEEALDYYKKSISLSQETHELSVEGIALMGMGNLYTELGNYPEALKYYLDALKIFEQEHDDALPTCLSNIATVYSSLRDYKKALSYNEQAQDIFQKEKNKMGILSTSTNTALIHGEMGDYRGSIVMMYKVVALADSIGDKYFKIICLANIGEAYYNLQSYDTAYAKYTIALNEAKAVGDDATIAQAENGMGTILVKKGKINEGVKHLLMAYSIMQQAGLKISIQEIAMNLSEAYEKNHDFISALKYYKIASTYNDSLYNEKSDRRIQQLQFDYELGKKEAQISLLQKDKVIAKNKSEKQSIIMWSALTILVFLIIASALLYRSRAFEKRSKNEIYKQKEEIQAQALKLTELNKFKDKTFSVLSHDLRGPIDSFYSIITMLDEKVITDDEYMKLKPEMSLQIASLTILLDNLLKWSSSYMKGQIAAKPANTNLHNIARQNINLLQNIANRKHITLTNAIPDATFAFCDAGQMDIVIRNLTMNAIKFTNRNGNVTISAVSDDYKTYISIVDNGVGMSKEQLNKLFMITADNHTYGTDGESGNGLGLLLCYEFVKSNNGTISVTSEINKGSVFKIILPKRPTA